VEQAAAIFSEPRLVLFVQLKTAAIQQPHFPSSSSSSSHISSSLATKLPPVYETQDHRDDTSSAKNAYSSDDAVMKGDVSGGEFGTHSPGGNTACTEVQELLRQWLPVHSLPDAIEVVDRMPFTKHGKFTLRCCRFHYSCRQ